MEQSTQTNRTYIEYISIYDKPKKLGRPNGTTKFPDEERKERSRMRSNMYYDENMEKERARELLDYHANENIVQSFYIYFSFVFLNLHSKKCRYFYKRKPHNLDSLAPPKVIEYSP